MLTTSLESHAALDYIKAEKLKTIRDEYFLTFANYINNFSKCKDNIWFLKNVILKLLITLIFVRLVEINWRSMKCHKEETIILILIQAKYFI